MRLHSDRFATKINDNRKGLRTVLLISLHKVSEDRGTKSIASSLLSISYIIKLAATDLVAQRFHWSPRGRKAILFSSQIGFRLYGHQFRLQKDGDSLKLSCDLSVTDQRRGGDRSALHRRPVADRLQSGF